MFAGSQQGINASNNPNNQQQGNDAFSSLTAKGPGGINPLVSNHVASQIGGTQAINVGQGGLSTAIREPIHNFTVAQLHMPRINVPQNVEALRGYGASAAIWDLMLKVMRLGTKDPAAKMGNGGYDRLICGYMVTVFQPNSQTTLKTMYYAMGYLGALLHDHITAQKEHNVPNPTVPEAAYSTYINDAVAIAFGKDFLEQLDHEGILGRQDAAQIVAGHHPLIRACIEKAWSNYQVMEQSLNRFLATGFYSIPDRPVGGNQRRGGIVGGSNGSMIDNGNSGRPTISYNENAEDISDNYGLLAGGSMNVGREGRRHAGEMPVAKAKETATRARSQPPKASLRDRVKATMSAEQLNPIAHGSFHNPMVSGATSNPKRDSFLGNGLFATLNSEIKKKAELLYDSLPENNNVTVIQFFKIIDKVAHDELSIGNALVELEKVASVKTAAKTDDDEGVEVVGSMATVSKRKESTAVEEVPVPTNNKNIKEEKMDPLQSVYPQGPELGLTPTLDDTDMNGDRLLSDVKAEVEAIAASEAKTMPEFDFGSILDEELERIEEAPVRYILEDYIVDKDLSEITISNDALRAALPDEDIYNLVVSYFDGKLPVNHVLPHEGFPYLLLDSNWLKALMHRTDNNTPIETGWAYDGNNSIVGLSIVYSGDKARILTLAADYADIPKSYIHGFDDQVAIIEKSQTPIVGEKINAITVGHTQSIHECEIGYQSPGDTMTESVSFMGEEEAIVVGLANCNGDLRGIRELPWSKSTAIHLGNHSAKEMDKLAMKGNIVTAEDIGKVISELEIPEGSKMEMDTYLTAEANKFLAAEIVPIRSIASVVNSFTEWCDEVEKIYGNVFFGKLKSGLSKRLVDAANDMVSYEDTPEMLATMGVPCVCSLSYAVSCKEEEEALRKEWDALSPEDQEGQVFSYNPLPYSYDINPVKFGVFRMERVTVVLPTTLDASGLAETYKSGLATTLSNNKDVDSSVVKYLKDLVERTVAPYIDIKTVDGKRLRVGYSFINDCLTIRAVY